ncbi:MAG TPA: ISNCY family transposase [Methylomirabilota bacterium]|nr:ISNCY family transposase [Methylomirabilota bacterium]
MSKKELPRAGLVKAALSGRITNRQGATALHLTIRQFQRLKRRFETGGAPALRHRGRGQPSPRRVPAKLCAKIAELMTTTYAGFNDVHLTEKLREVHALDVCRESVRRVRLGLGRPAKRPRQAPRHRRRRQREAASGALIQVDGSPCAWLEARGPRLTLLGAIDDATGAILALGFRPTEDLHGYATLFRQLFATHGLPLAVYGDRLNVFVRNDRHWTLDEELQGAQHPTHFGRMLQDLGVAYIAAHSPQAKGRIERLWATLQDRLTSELRLRGLTTLEAAARFLPEFIADYNRRFARPAADPGAVWRRPPRDLDRLLSCRYSVVVARDNTARLGPRWLQIPPGPRGRSYAGCRVELRELLDGRLLAIYHDVVLAAQAPPSAAFSLVPRRAPSADRRGNGAPATAAPAQLAQERRSHPAPFPEYPPKSGAVPPRAPRHTPPRRPARDHPWRRSIRLHVLRKTLRAQGMTFSRSSKG